MKKFITFILLLNISLYAHHPGHEENSIEQKKEICIDQKDLHFHSTISKTPKVGQLSILPGILKSSKNIFPVRYKIEIQNTEHEEIVFRAETLSDDGNLNWKYQFFDGAPHKILISIFDNKNQPVLSDYFITEVEPVEPPFFSIVRSMVLLLIITAIGIITGYFITYLFWKSKIANENTNN